jgi:transposase
MNSTSLPRDTTTLQALVVAQQAEIEHLKLIIAKLRRMQFGQSSEKIDEMAGQLELALEELETGKAERAGLSEITPAEEASGKPVRKPLPDHLPRDTVVHAPPHSCCPDCGGHLKPLGEDVSEVLDYVPASFRVIRHVRPKLACGRCDTIVQAPAVSRPIARGMAGPGLLAHVLVAKYCDHLPLYRQSGIYAREGVDLERSTLADWVGQCSTLLRPLVERLRQHVLGGEKLHADDTPVPVLAPGDGKTKTGRL